MEDMYKPYYSKDYQNTAREDFPVEVAALPLAPAQPKPSRRCQNISTQNEEAPCCTAWTNEEEIALCKGWVHVSKDSDVGKARKECGFWTEEMEYDAPERGSVLWSAHYIKCRAQTSVAGDEDYYATTLVDCEAEFGVSFILRHCWESEDASINLNVDVGDEEGDEVKELARPIG
ncbi:hypothetical protein Tco_0873547 [Tanacetum coccineum]|uniref:Uncharacterized protein n=1 Tax=Tanacetum coccineum TaxID=301880 RepID=A0ABQ5BJ38_9ASTR